jgi:hypothetical protein
MFVPSEKLTQERMDRFKVFSNEFLWEEEKKLAPEVLKVNEKGLAWAEADKERFCEDYFTPAIIPVVEHVPWFQKTILVPPAIWEKFIKLVKQKVAVGTYEPSMSSYHGQILAFGKPDGENI